MARANDNWERLMGAVMRRNKLWEMFHARSRTPSMSSAGSSMDDPFLDLSDDKDLGQYGKFSYGYTSSRGRRSFMGDFYETRIEGVDGEVVGLFGVFNGHGVARAADYVKKNLFSNLIRHPKFISDTKSAIADAYRQTGRELLNLEDIQKMDVGSTACTAIVVADRLLVANVGDSRAVICRAGKAIAVSKVHRREKSRFFQDLMQPGTWTVGGFVAVSRPFGHIMLKERNPEIEEEKVDETLELLILASNGLWDVVSNEEAVSITKPIQDPEEAARMLMLEARQRASADNITIIVVRFCGSSA
ncbi:putative protein phosphatase 2C 59 isoform X2 [Primulina tabacum]|uniref:putative protein phosphatase 2C 59 isoform X2 n=1 Tax=Primulina tabacum TaxID=48773 RepID=UPI003F5ABE3D